MALFDKKEQERIKKAGGRIEADGGYQPEEVEKAVTLLRGLMAGEKRGFFFVVEQSKADDTHTQSEGIAGVKNTNRMMVLETILRTLGMDTADVLKYATLRMQKDAQTNDS